MERKSYLYGAIAGVTASSIVIGHILDREGIPSTSEVQSGYAIPSKLEIDVQDLDGNGENEVLMKYDGKSYLLRLDEQGRPKVQPYEIRPSELIIREEGEK